MLEARAGQNGVVREPPHSLLPWFLGRLGQYTSLRLSGRGRSPAYRMLGDVVSRFGATVGPPFTVWQPHPSGSKIANHRIELMAKQLQDGMLPGLLCSLSKSTGDSAGSELSLRIDERVAVQAAVFKSWTVTPHAADLCLLEALTSNSFSLCQGANRWQSGAESS